MISHVLNIGGWYFYNTRGLPDFTKDIEEAETFDTHEDIEDFLTSVNHEYEREKIDEKMEAMQAPIVIESIIKDVR